MKPELNISELLEVTDMAVEMLNDNDVVDIGFNEFSEAVGLVIENVSGFEFVSDDQLELISDQCYKIFLTR